MDEEEKRAFAEAVARGERPQPVTDVEFKDDGYTGEHGVMPHVALGDKIGTAIGNKVASNPESYANRAGRFVADKLVKYAQWQQKQPGKAALHPSVAPHMKGANDRFYDAVAKETAKTTAARTGQRSADEQRIVDAAKKYSNPEDIRRSSDVSRQNAEVDEIVARARESRMPGANERRFSGDHIVEPSTFTREFPSTPQGEADKAAYIAEKARETARRASGK